VLQFFEWSRRGQHTLPLIDRTSARPTGSSYKNLHRLPVFLEEGLAAQGVTHKPLLQRRKLLVMLWTAPPPARQAPSMWVLLGHS
jgi:hypothetical protein